MDSIIINGDQHRIYSFPLDQYWERENNKPDLSNFITSLERGYYAKWIIESHKLFLTDFHGVCDCFSRSLNVENGMEETDYHQIEYSLSDIFPVISESLCQLCFIFYNRSGIPNSVAGFYAPVKSL